jgi:hypothetical protein
MVLSVVRCFRSLPSSSLGPVLLSLSALTAGCGDDSTKPDEQEGLALEAFAETYRQAQCERAVTCGFMPDVDACKEALAVDRYIVEGIAAVTYGDLTYDANAAQTCVDTLAATGCEGFGLANVEYIEPCNAVFGNRRGEGAACTMSIECEGFASLCYRECEEECCVGECRGVEAAGMGGDECSDLVPCGEGLRCLFDDTADGYRCRPLAGANQACVPFACIDGYACGSDSKCFQQAASGEPCNPSLGDVCASLNEYCSAADQICVPLPRGGDACGESALSSEHCSRSSICIEGTCEDYPLTGEDCIFEYCAGNLRCSGDPDFVCEPQPNPTVCVIGQ